jgi:penicillin-binding protein 2
VTEGGRAGLRLKVLAALVVAMFAALTTRLWFLQVLAADDYQHIANQNAVRLVKRPALRGQIKDASGEVLVGNRLSSVVTVNREKAGDDLQTVLSRLSQVLDVPVADLERRLDDPNYFSFSPIPVAMDVPKRLVFYIRERPGDFRGVEVVDLAVRTYPLGESAAHVLGYLSEIFAEELDSPAFTDYEPGDLVGRAGVEAVYEQDLSGVDGITKYRVNSSGENLGPIGGEPPVRGNDVVLTLDADLQVLAERSLILGMRRARGIFDSDSGVNLKANAGAAIVMNPDTGGIEAMVSFPSFNPKVFTRSLVQFDAEFDFDTRFGAATGYPLLNRAIAGEYPPGSVYKPWVALSALQRTREVPREPIVTTTDVYECPPEYVTPFDESDPNAIIYEFNNWTSANLGFMNLSRALALSCDTIFYPMGYEYWRLYYPPPPIDDVQGNDDVPARQPLQRDLRGAGFGRETHVDLPGELSGRVPTAEWKRNIHDTYPESFPEGEWFPGDFILMTIGQGDTLVTPIQLASAYSALMHQDQRVCTPHVVDRVVDPQGNVVREYRRTCRHRLPFDPGYVAYVRAALTGTVRDGTANGAFAGFPFDRVWVAGKTGTAEVDPKQDYSWFAAMTEALGERHVVVVLVEQGGHGSTTAAPIARRIIEGMYGLEFSDPTGVEVTD